MLLSNKPKREYSERCGFVRARMSPAIVRSTTLILQTGSGGQGMDGTASDVEGLRSPEARETEACEPGG